MTLPALFLGHGDTQGTKPRLEPCHAIVSPRKRSVRSYSDTTVRFAPQYLTTLLDVICFSASLFHEQNASRLFAINIHSAEKVSDTFILYVCVREMKDRNSSRSNYSEYYRCLRNIVTNECLCSRV